MTVGGAILCCLSLILITVLRRLTRLEVETVRVEARVEAAVEAAQQDTQRRVLRGLLGLKRAFSLQSLPPSTSMRSRARVESPAPAQVPQVGCQLSWLHRNEQELEARDCAEDAATQQNTADDQMDVDALEHELRL